METLEEKFDRLSKERERDQDLEAKFDALSKARNTETAAHSETAPLPVAGSQLSASDKPAPERPWYDPLTAAGQGAGQGLFLGFGDELAGAVGGAVRYWFDPEIKSYKQGYKAAVSDVRDEERRLANENPVSYGLGKVGGTVGSFVVGPGALVAKGGAGLAAAGKAAPVLARTLGGVGAGGAVGTTMGLGASEGETVGGDIKNALTGGAIGAATGGVGANFPLSTATAASTAGLYRALTGTEMTGGDRVAEGVMSLAGLGMAGAARANQAVSDKRQAVAQRRDKAIQQTRADVDKAARLTDETEADAVAAHVKAVQKAQQAKQDEAIKAVRDKENAQIADLEQGRTVDQLERDRKQLVDDLWKERDQTIAQKRAEADAIRAKIAKQDFKEQSAAHDEQTATANKGFQDWFKERAAVFKEADKLKAKDQSALERFDAAIAKNNAEAEGAPIKAQMAGVKQMRDLHTRLSNLLDLSKELGRPFEYMDDLVKLTDSLERNTPGEVSGVAPWLADFNEAKAAKLSALEGKINASTQKLAAEKAALQGSIEGRDYLAKAAANLKKKNTLSTALVDEAYQKALELGLDVPDRASFDPRAKYPVKGLMAPEAPVSSERPLGLQLADKLEEMEAAANDYDSVFNDKRLVKLDRRLSAAKGETDAMLENIVGRKPEADILREAGLDQTRSPSEIAQDYITTNDRYGGPEPRSMAETGRALGDAQAGVGEIMGKHIIARAAWDKLKHLIPGGRNVDVTPTSYDQFVAIDANTGRFRNPPQAAAALGKMYDATAFLERATSWSPELARKYAPALKQGVSTAQLLYFIERDPKLEKAVAEKGPEVPNAAAQ